MPTGTPGRPRATRTESVKTDESTSEFVSKYFLPFAAVITSAIFYYAGWVYIAHWYGFFGIDATQVNIPIQVIFLHGLPSMLIMSGGGFIFALIISSIRIFQKTQPSLSTLINTFIITYWGYSNLLFWVCFKIAPNQKFPSIELFFALMSFSLAFLVYLVIGGMQGFRFDPIFSKNARITVQGIFFLSYFFISTSMSSVLGEFDAARRGRFVVGNWRIPEAVLYSTEPIPALSNIENKLSNGNYEYAPLGLLISDDNVYYLIEWKKASFFDEKPKVYVVPRSSELRINLSLSPFDDLSESATQIPVLTTTPAAP